MSKSLQLVRAAWDVPRADATVHTKTSDTDLVTETDRAVEEMLIKGVCEGGYEQLIHVAGLSGTFPEHKFIGEESTADGKKIEWTDAPTWIIDPIDGTTNFVHRCRCTM